MKNSANLINSRLVKEFQVIQWLGKGGFGDVFLARLVIVRTKKYA